MHTHHTHTHTHTVAPPYPWVICSKAYHDYIKLPIISNTTYNMLFV
jgi:hypothetical protein